MWQNDIVACTQEQWQCKETSGPQITVGLVDKQALTFQNRDTIIHSEGHSTCKTSLGCRQRCVSNGMWEVGAQLVNIKTGTKDAVGGYVAWGRYSQQTRLGGHFRTMHVVLCVNKWNFKTENIKSTNLDML